MEVKFEFSLDQRVTTPFGDLGIVSICGVDDTGNICYVKQAGGGNWFKERELTAALETK